MDALLRRFATPCLTLITSLAAAFLLPACNDSSGIIDRQEFDRRQLVRMRQEILTLISDLSCSESTDCVTIAIGCKPCGGPWEILIYSTPNVDEALLQARVAAYDEADCAYNSRYGILSDCAMAPAPNPVCVDNTCVDLSGQPQAPDGRL